MRNFKLTSTLQKHKLSNPDPISLLLDVTIKNTDPQVVLRFARHTDDIIFKGNTYIAFNFEVDLLEETSTGQLPQVKVSVSNVGLTLQSYLDQYDGGIDSRVTIYVVPLADLAGDPDLQMDFVVTNVDADKDYVIFTLGADSPLRAAFPQFIYLENHCHHVYASPALQAANDPRIIGCAYAGNIASCDKTLDGANGCRAHGNSARFGGFIGIATQGFRAAALR